MDRKVFMRELEYLLQDISEDERKEALSFYESYFDEAGKENEQKVIEELGTPERLAAMIKDGLGGHFDEHISSGNQGFSNDQYRYQTHEVKQANDQRQTSLKRKWDELNSRDRVLLMILLAIAVIPLSFSIVHTIFNAVGGLLGAGMSMIAVFFCMIFGFWIVTFVLHIIAIVMIVLGVIRLFTFPGAGLIYVGIGCVLMSLGMIFGKLATWFFKDCLPQIGDFIRGLFQKEGGAS